MRSGFLILQLRIPELCMGPPRAMLPIEGKFSIHTEIEKKDVTLKNGTAIYILIQYNNSGM
jgi:hypothetical protein